MLDQIKNVLDLRKEMQRRMSQRERILKLLQKRGRVTNLDLARISYRYSARLGELRKDGYMIVCAYRSPGVYTYSYMGRSK